MLGSLGVLARHERVRPCRVTMQPRLRTVMNARKRPALIGSLCAAVVLGVTLAGQAPQTNPATPTASSGPASAPAIDLSGYWSPVVHEDGLERGAGSEIADYGG